MGSKATHPLNRHPLASPRENTATILVIDAARSSAKSTAADFARETF
jgi:hypothetical protein